MRRFLLAAAAVLFAVVLVAGGRMVLPATAQGGPELYGCLQSGALSQVTADGTVPSCAPGAAGVAWQSDPFPTPSPSPTPVGCPGTAYTGGVHCGPYRDAGITMSNGYDTYVGTNCWSHPGCGYTLAAPAPATASSTAPWTVTATEVTGHTGVQSYPNTSQLTNDWNGTGWGPGGITPHTNTPLSAVKTLTSSYSETMPHNTGTIAEAAWDLWLDSQGTGNGNEVMVWVDNVNRASGGAPQLATATIAGQNWTLYGSRAGELIWSLDGPGGTGTFAQQSSGTVDLLALLNWLVSNGYKAPGTMLDQLDFGYEICSTGSAPETFTLNSYTVTGS